MCMMFGCNPQIIFVAFSQFGLMSLMGLKHLNTGYPTPPTSSPGSFYFV